MSDDPKRDAWDARSIALWHAEEHERAIAEDDIQIIARCPVLWSGWEGDCGVVHYRIRSSGEHGLHVLDGIHHGSDPEDVVALMRERLDAYRDAIAATEALLASLERDALMAEIFRDFEEIGSIEDDDS